MTNIAQEVDIQIGWPPKFQSQWNLLIRPVGYLNGWSSGVTLSNQSFRGCYSRLHKIVQNSYKLRPNRYIIVAPYRDKSSKSRPKLGSDVHLKTLIQIVGRRNALRHPTQPKHRLMLLILERKYHEVKRSNNCK